MSQPLSQSEAHTETHAEAHAETSSEPASPYSYLLVFLQRRVHSLAHIVLYAGIVQVLALFFRSQHYIADLRSHFALFACMVLSIQLLLSILCRHGRLVLALFIVWAITFLYSADYNDRQVTTAIAHEQLNTTDARRLRFMACNVLSSNKTQAALLDYLLASEVDVLVILEITHAWKQQLQRLEQQLPYKIIRTRSDNFGIAIYARYPLTGSVEMFRHVNVSLPYIYAQVQIGDQQACEVFAVHTLPPLTAERWAFNHAYIQHCLSRLSQDLPSILLGDLNTTPNGQLYTMLQAHEGLIAAGAGRALLPTWGLPFVSLLQLDHIFVSPDVTVLSDELGPRCGSDHHPVCTEVLLKWP